MGRLAGRLPKIFHPCEAAAVEEVVGVLHRQAVFRLGESGEHQLTPALSLERIAQAHIHQVHIVVIYQLFVFYHQLILQMVFLLS